MCDLSARYQWLIVSAGLILALAGHLATAQSRADIFVGYSYVGSGIRLAQRTGHFSLESTGRASLNGWDVSASVRVARWLRGAAEVGGGYGTVPMLFSELSPFPNQRFNANTNLHTYLFGPRVAVSVAKVTPFAQALFGLAHQSIAGNGVITNAEQKDSAFALDLGGGIDFSLISKLGFRIGADYLRTTLFNQTQNDPRLTAGIVLRF